MYFIPLTMQTQCQDAPGIRLSKSSEGNCRAGCRETESRAARTNCPDMRRAVGALRQLTFPSARPAEPVRKGDV
jgi:hypothetical protein